MLVDDPNNLVRDLLVRVGLPSQPTPTVSMGMAMRVHATPHDRRALQVEHGLER